MYTIWTKNLKDTNEKEDFERSLYGSKTVINRLKDILDEMKEDLDKAEISPKNYEIPNWDYRQAHNNGYRQSLAVVRKLIDLDQQKDTKE